MTDSNRRERNFPRSCGIMQNVQVVAGGAGGGGARRCACGLRRLAGVAGDLGDGRLDRDVRDPGGPPRQAAAGQSLYILRAEQAGPAIRGRNRLNTPRLT